MNRFMQTLLFATTTFLLLNACTASPPATNSTPELSSSSFPTHTPYPNDTPTPRPSSSECDPTPVGILALENYHMADAGNFVLTAGEPVTLSWQSAPANADRYEFIFIDMNTNLTTTIAIDDNPADGASILWNPPEDSSLHVNAVAYDSQGCGTRAYYTPEGIYTRKGPKPNVCSLEMITSLRQPYFDLYPRPTYAATPTAELYGWTYVEVYQVTTDHWYQIDGSTEASIKESRTDHPTDPIWLHLDPEKENHAIFKGPCENLPVVPAAPTEPTLTPTPNNG